MLGILSLLPIVLGLLLCGAEQARTWAEIRASGLKIGRFLFVEKIAAAFRKGNDSVGAAYDRALAEVMADGTYKSISQAYFKSDIRCP